MYSGSWFSGILSIVERSPDFGQVARQNITVREHGGEKAVHFTAVRKWGGGRRVPVYAARASPPTYYFSRGHSPEVFTIPEQCNQPYFRSSIPEIKEAMSKSSVLDVIIVWSYMT